MKRLFLPILAVATAASAVANEVILVVGAPGESEFGERFETAAGLWTAAAKRGKAKVRTVRKAEPLKSALAESASAESEAALWLVFIGHGTFDQREAKFNLAGPDISAADIAAAIKDHKRPVAVINTSAASAPFLHKLSAPNRVIVTATKSGTEESYAHFGEYLAEGIASVDEADIDQDGAVSLLEGFLYASREVAEFFEGEGRIATEEALLDDNGDGLGTPADWFRGVRAVRKPKKDAIADGLRAHQFHLVPSPDEIALTAEQRRERDKLEMQVLKLRERKDALAEEDYYARLEALLLQLARLYEGVPPRDS